MLSGNRIFGHIKTSQGGHALTNKLLKKFFSEKSNWCYENFENMKNKIKILMKNLWLLMYKIEKIYHFIIF